MATYYRWRKSDINYIETTGESRNFYLASSSGLTLWYSNSKPDIVPNSNGYGQYHFDNSMVISGSNSPSVSGLFFDAEQNTSRMYKGNTNARAAVHTESSGRQGIQIIGSAVSYDIDEERGDEIGYVYSTNRNSYSNGGITKGYWYDQRTTVTSPTAPSRLSYPATITTLSVGVTWTAATSNTNYPVSGYQVDVSTNGGTSWTLAGNPNTNSLTYYITSGTTSIMFRVRAKDSNGQWGSYVTGTASQVIQAPGAPTVSAPSTAVSGENITVTWGAISGATSYTVQRNTGGSWTQVYSGNALTFSETVGVWDSLQYRVQAVNQAGGGSWGYSGAITVYTSPTLSVPSKLMQGQQATVSWTAIPGADSYTLQRKANTNAYWTQVYSGANRSYSETVGAWTSVQYRVQAVFDGTPGGWATSAEIPVVSASALVISGQDGDLGTLVNDVPYTILTDTGNQITATITANGAVIFSGNVGNSVSDVIPVLDLINGQGTIVIEASVTASSGPVSAVRTWTYTKTMMTFPNAGSIAELTKNGKVMWPETLAEAVRIPGGKTLDQVIGNPFQMYTGSYVGTGAYGTNNPNELTFPFEPKIIIGIVPEDDSSALSRSMIRPNQQSYVGNYPIYVTWDGNSVSWYSTNGGTQQLNRMGKTYYYVALG